MILISPLIPRQKTSYPEKRNFSCEDAYQKAFCDWENYPWVTLDKVIHDGKREHMRNCYRPHSRSGSYNFRILISEKTFEELRHEDWYFSNVQISLPESAEELEKEGFDFELFGMKGTILNKDYDWLEILH